MSVSAETFLLPSTVPLDRHHDVQAAGLQDRFAMCRNQNGTALCHLHHAVIMQMSMQFDPAGNIAGDRYEAVIRVAMIHEFHIGGAVFSAAGCCACPRVVDHDITSFERTGESEATKQWQGEKGSAENPRCGFTNLVIGRSFNFWDMAGTPIVMAMT